MPTITANVPLLEGVYDITIDGQAITSVDPSTQTTDLYAGPTLFDVQVNGYGGRTCRLAGPQAQDALVWIARLMHELGVGWWMPTITTSTPEVLETAFACCGRALDEDRALAASIPGLHLEGPYISPVDGPRGAHRLECVRPPDWDEFCRLQDASGGRIRLVTVAPEVDGAIDFIERCVGTGVVVGMGHTNLDREALLRAVDAGATLSTHLGNGAHDQLQRHNNYLWYQLASRQSFASFIADGHHLPQECLYSMVHAKGIERSILVSDTVLLGGMSPGRYQVYDHEIEMLPSGRIVIPGSPNLAGSASNLLECTANAIRMAGLSHADGWRLASTNPARLMGLDDRLGIAEGKEATLTVYKCPDGEDGANFDVVETWVAGTKVFDARTSERAVLPDAPLDASMPI
ncbi:MAG: amidohydrolase family protein [Gemmatimonadetes bacterium]|nr:amidohydrolase family protein [Gemmatimonadota bacterium]MBT6144081.1 amidohydrolase family protein [Gemmatimonadota bacterium]MBT7861750.1 amidohydrolase family protein [Gemmatimonadota bacterium]